MRGIICSFLLLSLAACSTVQPGIRTQIVERPVIQVEHCVEASDVPHRPETLASGPAPTGLENALSLALAKLSEWTRYGNETEAILQACVESPNG